MQIWWIDEAVLLLKTILCRLFPSHWGFWLHEIIISYISAQKITRRTGQYGGHEGLRGRSSHELVSFVTALAVPL